MDIEKKNHRLGFQVILYFIVLLAMSLVVNAVFGVGPNWVMRKIGVSENTRVFAGSTFTYLGRMTSIILLSAWMLIRVIGVNPWQTMFGGKDNKWWKELLFGMGLSVGIMLLIFIIERQLGWLEVQGWRWQSVSRIEYFRAFWIAILVNMTVAISEEVIFRGFLLTGIEKAWGHIISLVVMAVLFSAIHIGVIGSNETNTILFILVLAIPGFVFGWIYFQTRSLWIPMGLHFCWNLMQDDVLNLHGRGSPNLFGAITIQSGPPWVVGTNYGIEVGLAGVLGMGLVCLCAILWSKKTHKR